MKMNKNRMYAATAVLLIGAVLAGMALAVVVFQLDIANTCKLTTTLGLELRDNQTNVISSYAWGEFNHLELKQMCSTVGDGDVRLWNTGNGLAVTTWTSDIASAWELRVTIDTNGTNWASGNYYSIPAGQSLALKITVRELTAIGGQVYTWNLLFKQEG